MVRNLVIIFFAVFTMIASANADEFGTKDEAIAMVHRVQEMFKKDGADATFKTPAER